MFKKKFGFYLSISIIFIFFPGCGDDLWTTMEKNHHQSINKNIDFYSTVTSGKVPLTIKFYASTESDLLEWRWDFNNDGIIDSNEQNPEYVYNEPDRYSVKLDVVYSDGITEYEKRKNYITVFEPFDEKTISADRNYGWPLSVYPADIDGDGDQDVVGVDDFYQGIVWWENRDQQGVEGSGNGSQWTEPQRIFSLSDQAGYSMLDGLGLVLPADVDQDGDMDILSLSLSPKPIFEASDVANIQQILQNSDENNISQKLKTYIVWWENAGKPDEGGGNGTAWLKHLVSEDVFFYPHCLKIADIDNDGFQDILSVASSMPSEVKAILKVNKETKSSSTRGSVLPDVDSQDSREEVYENTDRTNLVCWWKNGGNGLEWTEYIIDDTDMGPSDLDVADFDKDGYIDIVCTFQEDNKILWWKNSGTSPPTWEKNTISQGIDQAFQVCAADIDGDETQDIITSSYNDDKILLWRNRGGFGLSWEKQIIAEQLDTPYSLNCHDMDDDKDLDVLFTNILEGQFIGWLENPGTPGSHYSAALQWTSHILNFNFNVGGTILPVNFSGGDKPDLLCSSVFDHKISWWNINE